MKRAVTVLFSAAALAGWIVPAWGEVSAEDPTVPKDADAEITFVVPAGEEGGHAKAMQAMDHPQKPGPGAGQGEPSQVYNEEVTIDVPRGFEVLSCDQTTEWKCEAEPTEGSEAAGQAPGGTITFTRVTKSGTNMDHLSFTVHTPTQVGRYSFPTTQKTSNGEETEWRGDGITSKNRSPIVQVVDEEGEKGPDAGHDHK